MTILTSSGECIDSNIDADGDATYDSSGDGCDWYNTDSRIASCGNWDDSDFTANQMCCSCGGGDEYYYQLIFDVTDPNMTVTVYEIPITI